MKKLINLVIVAFVIVAFAACGNKKNSPEAVAEKFLNHKNKKEYAEAKKLGTDNTKQMLEMLESFENMDKKAEPAKEIKIENMKCEVKGDSAKCTFTENGVEGQPLDLVKKDGNWLVDMRKEANGETEMIEPAADSTAVVQ